MSSLHQEVVLNVNADSTEFCPISGLQNLLAVGTYELEETSQTRHGLLHLYVLGTDSQASKPISAEPTDRDTSWQMQLLQKVPISGIFDMRWQHQHPACLLAACADGSLYLLSVEQTTSSPQLVKQQAISISDDAMAVSLDVVGSGQDIVVSLSSGTVSSLQVQTYPQLLQCNRQSCTVFQYRDCTVQCR